VVEAIMKTVERLTQRANARTIVLVGAALVLAIFSTLPARFGTLAAAPQSVRSSTAAVATSPSPDMHPSTPEGPGSVSQAPYLPSGFTKTFTSRYVNAGQVRLHAVIGGDGPPLLLVHGWPQTWYQWRLVMPTLARNFTVIAVDQRGMGLSDKPASGYDVGTLADDLVALMDTLGYRRFAVIGFDTGMPIGYALAADHPDRVERLVVGEASIPGVSPSPPLIVAGPVNARLWHIAFNRLAGDVNERLVRGREEVYFGAEYAASAGTPLPDQVVKYYIERLASDPEALRGSFEWYRAIDVSSIQNERRKARRLTIPVLAIGGAKSSGEGTANTMKLVADDVKGVVIHGSGHWVAEEAPEPLLSVLAGFLAPYQALSQERP
jgi:pimeloyl-ACP methyl ester carboxylesterase